MTKGRIEIAKDLCKGCGLCVASCKHDVIELSKDDNVNAQGYHYLLATNMDNCTGCAMCGQMCPDSVISVYREVKK